MKLRSCSVLIILAVLSAATSGHFFGVPVRAAPTPQLFVAPQSQPLANPGSTVTFSVNVSGIGMDHSLAGWEIYGRDGDVPVPPQASFYWTPLMPRQGDVVTFNASLSSDPNGHALVSYSWVFAQINGGAPLIEASGVIVNNIFDAGNWTATLTVKN